MIRDMKTLLSLLLICNLAAAEASLEYIRANAVESSSALYEHVKKFKVITLGEMHGTNEGPQLALLLVKLLEQKGHTILLGVEMPRALQSPLNVFLQTGDISSLEVEPFFQRPFQDGRSSRAMVALLDGVRSFDNVTVHCFDPNDSASDQDRDEKMALNVTSAMKAGGFDYAVVLAGNIHTRVSKGNPILGDEYRSMAYELHHGKGAIYSENEILSIRLFNELGEAWTCQKRDCKAHPVAPGKTNYSQALTAAAYFLPERELYEGHRATYFVRTFTASPPLVDVGNGKAIPNLVQSARGVRHGDAVKRAKPNRR